MSEPSQVDNSANSYFFATPLFPAAHKRISFERMKHLRIVLCISFVALALGCTPKADAQKEHVADRFHSGSIISFHSVAPLCFSKHLLKTLLQHMENNDNAAVKSMYEKQDCVLVANENIKLNYFKIVSIERPYIEVVGIESKESHGLWSHMLFFKEPSN